MPPQWLCCLLQFYLNIYLMSKLLFRYFNFLIFHICKLLVWLVLLLYQLALVSLCIDTTSSQQIIRTDLMLLGGLKWKANSLILILYFSPLLISFVAFIGHYYMHDISALVLHSCSHASWLAWDWDTCQARRGSLNILPCSSTSHKTDYTKTSKLHSDNFLSFCLESAFESKH